MSRWRAIGVASLACSLMMAIGPATVGDAATARVGPAHGIRTATRTFVAPQRTYRAVRTEGSARRHPAGDSIGLFTEYALRLGSSPKAITTGPDGNVWFTEETQPLIIARITADGIVTEFTAANLGASNSITTGPDGALWFTCRTKHLVARMTTDGVITEYAIQVDYGSQSITAGPDGALWFTELKPVLTRYGYIGRLTTEGVLTEYLVPILDAYPGAITGGPDGNVWFTEASDIGRITPSGVITSYPVLSGGDPWGIAAGPDGNVWFTIVLFNVPPGSGIGKIHPDGHIGFVSEGCAMCGAAGITAAADGRMWFLDGGPSAVNRIAGLPPGGITKFPTPTPNAGPLQLCRGPDGNIWLAERNVDKIAMVTDEPISAARFTPTTGPPGTVVSVTGTNYGSFEPVDVAYVDRVSGTRLLTTVRTDSTGSFTATVDVPLTATQGVQGLRATGEISGLVRQHSFVVT